MGWTADFDLGLDYFAGQTQVFDLQGNRDEFDQSGLGYSLGLGFDNGLGLRVSSSSFDGNQASSLPVGTVELDVAQLAQLDSTSFSLSWQWSHYWLGARYRQQDELSRIEGIRTGRRDRVLSLDVQENSESSSFSIEAGRDWFVGNWAPSLGVSLATTEGDFSRVERVDSFNASQVQTFEQSLEGTDVSLTASLAWLSETSGGALLVPAASLFHRVQIEGQVAGSGTIRTDLGDTRPGRSGDFSFDDPLDAQDETYLDFSFSLIEGPWLASVSYSMPLAGGAGNSLYLGLGYQF